MPVFGMPNVQLSHLILHARVYHACCTAITHHFACPFALHAATCSEGCDVQDVPAREGVGERLSSAGEGTCVVLIQTKFDVQ